MAVRRRPDGTWEFDSVAEAAEWERLRTGARPTPREAAASTVTRPAPAEPKGLSDKRAVDALRLLTSAGKRGLPTAELAPHLGLSNLRGFSGVAQGIRNRIKEAGNGTPVDRVFWGKDGRWFVDVEKVKELGIT